MTDGQLKERIRMLIVQAGDATYEQAIEQMGDMPDATQSDMWKQAERLLEIGYSDFDYIEKIPEIGYLIDMAHDRGIKVTTAEGGFLTPKCPEEEWDE